MKKSKVFFASMIFAGFVLVSGAPLTHADAGSVCTALLKNSPSVLITSACQKITLSDTISRSISGSNLSAADQANLTAQLGAIRTQIVALLTQEVARLTSLSHAEATPPAQKPSNISYRNSNLPLTWSAPMNVDGSTVIHGIFCSSSSFCIGVDHAGNVITSTNPAGGAGAWTVAHIGGNSSQLDAISCPSPSLCIATDVNMNDFSGDILTSVNPTGGAGAWSVAHFPQTGGIGGLWCPSVTLCVASDHNGDILTSTNPTGGVGAWTIAHVNNPNTIHGVYCPSNSFCIAGDEVGDILTSVNPTGGASAWTVTPLNTPFPAPILGVSCSSPSFCAAVDGPGGDILTSANPTSGASAWTVTHLGPGFGGISCPSAGLCVAVSAMGKLAVSYNPAGGANTWNILNADNASLWDVLCPSDSFCAASDGAGNVLIGKK